MPKLRRLLPHLQRGGSLVALTLFGTVTLIVFIGVLFAFRGDAARQADVATRVLGFGGSITGILYLIFRQERTHEKLDAVKTDAETAVHKAEEVGQVVGQIRQQTNGGMEEHVKAAVEPAVKQAVGRVCDDFEDVRREVHKMKHDLAGLSANVSLVIQELERERAEKAKQSPPDGL